MQGKTVQGADLQTKAKSKHSGRFINNHYGGPKDMDHEDCLEIIGLPMIAYTYEFKST